MQTALPPLPPGFRVVPQQQSAPPVIQGPPRTPPPQTPDQVVVGRGQANAAPYQGPRAEADVIRAKQQIQQEDTGGVNEPRETALRERYGATPEVRNYMTAMPLLQAARGAGEGGAGDLQIVYNFAKIMDPGSVVRESEVEMSQGTGGLGERINGMIRGLRNGGRLPREVRQRLIQEMENRISSYEAPYNQTRKQYWHLADRYGFSPDAVIGEDIAESFSAGGRGSQGPSIPAPGRTIAAQMGDAATDPGALGRAAGGALTTTDIRESALSSPVAVEGEADPLTGDNPAPRIQTEDQWNQVFSGAVRGGASREQLDELSRSTGHVPVTDELWNAIVEHRRTGRQMQFVPNSVLASDLPEGMRQDVEQQYQDQSDARQGAEDRRAWAEEHPYLASFDTGARRVANTVSLGAMDHVAGFVSGRGAAYEHGVTNADWQDRPLESLAGTFAGGARLPYGNNALTQTAAGTGYGFGTGFLETDGSLQDRLGAGARGAAMGGGSNALLAGASRAVRSPNAQAIMDAGERQNVYVPRYMTGRETAQVGVGMVGATPGRIPLARAANRTIEGLEGARDRAASQIGDVGDNFEAGRRAQSGARQFVRDSSDRADQLFQRIPIRPETPATLTNTRQALGELTEGLTSNPRLSEIIEDRRLIQIRDALTSGDLSWADQRRFRSMVGEWIGQPQVAGEVTSRAALRRVYSALTADMQATAATQGPRALSMFNRANQYYRGREARREGVISDILGSDGNAAPEDAYRQINRWAQRDTGNTRALAQAMRSLPADDANAVRATLFARMGRATRGNQDETGEVFSPQTFASQWAQLEPRAKALLVPNRQHRRNLEDIALLTSAMRRSERFTNTSNTGLGVAANFGALGLGAGAAGVPLAIKAAGAAVLSGHLLSTPAGSRTFLRALRNPETFHGMFQEEGSAE